MENRGAEKLSKLFKAAAEGKDLIDTSAAPWDVQSGPWTVFCRYDERGKILISTIRSSSLQPPLT